MLFIILQMSKNLSSEQQLHLAVKENETSRIETLLNGGVDINCLFYGWSPLQYAISLGKYIVQPVNKH